MIPILFTEDTVSFNNNGLGHLVETLDYEVYEARNGQFELTLEYPITGKLFKELKDFRIILAKPNDTDEDHAFRIYEMIKDLETGTVFVHASTRSNDLAGNLITEVHVRNETPQQAMDKMVPNLIHPTDYRFVSDIQTKSSTDWIRRNPLNAIAGEEGSLVHYWGGEIKRTNNIIYLYSRRGKDNVTTIRQGKNLNGFTLTASTKGMVTRILPYFTYTPEGREDQVTITGSIVDSPLVNKYPVRYIQPVDYSFDENVTNLATLNSVAKSYFTHQNPDIDKPSVNVEVDLMQLSDSSEYEKFKGLEHISLTDTVTVWVEKFDVDVTVKINELTYNGMKEQVTSIVAGSKVHSLYDDIGRTYNDKVSELQAYVSGMENGIRNVIQLTADGKNTIFRGYTEPSVDISNVNDLWYKELGSGEKEVYIFDGAYWQPLITAGLNEETKAAVGNAITVAENLRGEFETQFASTLKSAKDYTDQKAIEWSSQVDTDISNIRTDIETGYTNSVAQAKVYTDQKATEFDTSMGLIQDEVDGMKVDITDVNTLASGAVAKADTAIRDTATALSKAEAALDEYTNLTIGARNLIVTYGAKANKTLDANGNEITLNGNSIMDKWIEVIPGEVLTFSKKVTWIAGDEFFRWNWYNSASTRLGTSSNDSNEFQWTVPNFAQFIKISYPNGAESKLERGTKRTDWTPAPEDTQVQIDNINGTLSTAIHRTEFDLFKGTVNNYGTRITQNETNISKMATAEYVNTINNTVTQHTSLIDQNAKAITQRLTSTQVDALVSGKGYVTTSELTSTSNSLTSKITGVQTNLDDLEIGERNLIDRSGLTSSWETAITDMSKFSAKFWATQILSNDWVIRKLEPNQEYTIRFKVKLLYKPSTPQNNTWVSAAFNLYSNTRGSFTMADLGVVKYSSMKVGDIVEVERTFIAPSYVKELYVLAYCARHDPGELAEFEFSELKIVEGNKATSGWTPAPEDMATLTQFQQLTNEFSFYVREDGLISEFNIQAGRTLISTGKLLLDANTYIMGTTFANDVKAKSLEAVHADISWLRTNVLTADSITSTHLKTDAASINKLFATTAAIDALTGKTAFIDDIKATSVTAVRADISWLRTNVLTADSVTTTQLKVDTAMINYLFATDALVNTLTAKTAFINSVKAVTIAADKITSGTLNATNVNIINLNVSKLVGDTSNFVRSAWNSAVGGSVSIQGDGILSTAPDNSQVYIQNGVVGARNPQGASLGNIGYRDAGGRPFYNIRTSWGANFSITANLDSGGQQTTMLDIFPGSSETYIWTNDFRHVGRSGTPFARFSGNVTVDGALNATTSTVTAQRYSFRYGSWIYDNSNDSMLNVVGGGRFRIYTGGATSAGSNSALIIDTTHMYLTRTLSMEGYKITNQSDGRLKKNIKPTEIKSLNAIKSWTFVGYDWISEEGPKERQFGLIAQDTPDLAIYDASRDKWSIDSSKQVMMNSHAIQQLAIQVDGMNGDVIRHETFIQQYQHQLYDHARRIEELEEKIRKLEAA